MNKDELVWGLVKSAKEIEITDDFFRRYKSAKIGDILEIKGFWNVNSRLLTPYSNFRPIGINKIFCEIRLEHEINKGELVILSLTPEQKNSLGMLDNYTYLSIRGRKSEKLLLMSNNFEKITPNLPLLEVDEIRREEIEKYYEKDILGRGFNIDVASNLIYEFIPDNHIAEGTITNLLNMPVLGTGRSRGMIPLVFTQNVDKKFIRYYVKYYKEFIAQLLNENESKNNLFKISYVGEKKIRGEIDYLITGMESNFSADNETIKSADAPILIRKSDLPLKGVAFKNFDVDDLSYLKIFKKLVLIFKSSKPSVKEKDFDKEYVKSFMDVVNDLPENKKYYYLGLSMHDRVISSELSIGYGRKLDIANTLSKDKNKNFELFSSKFAFAEDLVMDAVDNRKRLTMDEQIYKDGVKLYKKGFGSFRREISKIRKAIVDGGCYSIDGSELSKSVGSDINFQVFDNLRQHGLLVRRLDNKISLHPSLFK